MMAHRILLAAAITVLGATVLNSTARAQDATYWGNYVDGWYGIADETVQFYAFSYVGNFGDKRGIWDHAWKAVAEVRRTNRSHEYKDGNGNYNELRLGQEKIFVIGWWNAKARGGQGDGGFMATVPGSNVVYSSHKGDLENTGWNRQTWISNGHRINLQLGRYNGCVQYQLGFDD